MSGDSGVLVVTRVRSTTTKCTRGRGCNGHPAFPTPSLGRKIHQRLGRMARRGRERVFELGNRHSGMRHLAQARNPYSPPWLWIPGSLAQRKIDARINFAARLAPRNDNAEIP